MFPTKFSPLNLTFLFSTSVSRVPINKHKKNIITIYKMKFMSYRDFVFYLRNFFFVFFFFYLILIIIIIATIIIKNYLFNALNLLYYIITLLSFSFCCVTSYFQLFLSFLFRFFFVFLSLLFFYK